MTLFASMAQDYLRLKQLVPTDDPPGRMIALAGDAELDEGNIFEALLEGWKHDVRNLWWVIDYNRQSLDAVVSDRLFGRIDAMFEMMGWRVVTLKYGRLLEAAFARPDGHHLREWIDACPNSLYSALVYKGGEGWREHLHRDLNRYPGIRAILDDHDDAALAAPDDQPRRPRHGIGSRRLSWRRRRPADLLHRLYDQGLRSALRRAQGQPRRFDEPRPDGVLPAQHGGGGGGRMGPVRRARPAAGAALGVPCGGAARRVRPALARCAASCGAAQPSRPRAARRCRRRKPSAGSSAISPPPAVALADRIVTTSPDVTVSTNLGPWVNRRGIFDRAERADTFREEKVVSAQRWAMSPKGQHIELGIAESNLFLQLAALGLAGPLFGTRLLPIGTLYDPFIKRGLDVLNYACYQDARFILVATPSGHHLGARRRRPPVDRRAADRARPARARQLRAGLRRRAGGAAALGIRGDPAERRQVGLFPAVDASGRATGAEARRRARGGDHRRRLLAARAGGGGGTRDRLLRRGRPRGARRPPGAGRRHPRARGCSRSPRPTGCTATGGPPAPAAR